uniref:Uncharacterized protein n=2 Tax=Photinus pyralis TaxID=7054 RepID=A0A1Y1JZ43_PHOPY
MEMCESLQVFANSSKRSVQQLVKQILPNIMQETDVDSIVKDLTDFLSTDFTYEQQTVVKDTAHQIYTFLHSESNVEELSESARELLIKVINETITSAKDANALIEEILLKLVHCLPIRFLIRQSTVDMILAEIRCHLLDNDESLLEAILNISTESTDDLQELLDSIIETVYKSKS